MLPRLTPALALGLPLLVAACGPAAAPLVSASTDWSQPGADAGIAGAHLTQAVQDLAGSVPLVQGRDALLRVFLGSRIAGVPAPAVHVSLVSTGSGAALQRYTATSPLAVIPTRILPGTRSASWNVLVPGDQIQPDRHLVVEIGEVAGVASGRVVASVRLPATGSLDVQPVAPLRVTLVPVIQSGLVPDVDRLRTARSWVSLAAAVYPFPGVEVEVAPAYTSAAVLDGTSESWSDLLAELEELRATRGSTRHWIGAVKTMAPGIAGRGIVGGAALLASDDPDHYQRVVAHELGHNLGLRHAPCGTDDGLDADWPSDAAYADGHTGVAGWDPRRDAILDPRATFDLMSYCGAEADTWISDHTYLEALDALQPAAVAAADPLAAWRAAPVLPGDAP